VLARDASERAKVWETRRSISLALRAMRPWKISEDVAVPRGRLLDMVREVRRIGKELGILTAAYGHAGDGNLHVNLLLESRDDTVRIESAIEAVMRAAVSLGGTITGEHGVGLAKKKYLSLEQSPALIEAQRRLKAALDPDGILNPEKILPGPNPA
jgi:glycolate oxidase